ncbi:MAG: GspH/FimT family protein [Casimicrobiaceae bacterium]
MSAADGLARPKTPRARQARSRSRPALGFTLMELLVVLVLVAVVVALAPPLWSNAVPVAEHRAAARQVAQMLKAARGEAVARRVDVPVEFDLSARTVRLIAPTSAATANRTYTLPEGIAIELTTTVAETQSAERGSVRFYPDGGSSGGRVTLRVGERGLRIDIDWLSGRIAIDEG